MDGKAILAPWLGLILCWGCASGKTVHELSTEFDAAEAERLLLEGDNRVEGYARLDFSEGGNATCAGLPVLLIPATEYARERTGVVFNQQEVLFYPQVGGAREVRFEPDEPSFARLVHTTTCDPDGNFKFAQIADGKFFLMARVNWMAKGTVYGAEFIKEVRLSDGKTVTVELSQDTFRYASKPRPINH